MERWIEEEDAGDHGEREYLYADSVVALVLMALTMVFEQINEYFKDSAAALSKKSARYEAGSEVHPHVAAHAGFRDLLESREGARELPEHVKGQPEHLRALHHLEDGSARPNYVSVLLARMNAELTVLGFLAFFVWVLHHEVLDAISERNEDAKWGPQRSAELSEVIEISHMALFLGMCLYFGIIYISARLMMRVNGRFLEYEEHLARERTGAAQGGLAPHLAHGCAWFKGLRDRFVAFAKPHVPEVDDEFPFALYLRLFSDAVMDDFTEVTTVAWLAAMGMHVAEVLLARHATSIHRVGHFLDVVEAAFNTLCLGLAFAGHRLLHGKAVFGMHHSSNVKTSEHTEVLLIRLLQAFALIDVYHYARALCRGAEDGWIVRTYVVLFMAVLGPLFVVYGNILLRVPPFCGEDDFETIAAVARFKHRAANAPAAAIATPRLTSPEGGLPPVKPPNGGKVVPDA